MSSTPSASCHGNSSLSLPWAFSGLTLKVLVHTSLFIWTHSIHVSYTSVITETFHYLKTSVLLFSLFYLLKESIHVFNILPWDFWYWNLMVNFSIGIIVPALFINMYYCRLPLSEDPALAMAFSVARRAAAVPLLLVNGTYRKTIRTYLDSSVLQYQLQRLDHSPKGLGPH